VGTGSPQLKQMPGLPHLVASLTPAKYFMACFPLIVELVEVLAWVLAWVLA
jgi:hypothetical protein